MSHIHELRHDGYSVVRDVFSCDEIERLRAILHKMFESSGTYKYGGKYKLRGLHDVPAVAELVLNEKLMRIIKSCTDPDAAVLTGECDLHVDVLSSWHKDVKADWAERTAAHADPAWRVYKAAIYLQDQNERVVDALKVRPGSHLVRLGYKTEVRALTVRAGDVVVFDVRIDHAGRTASLAERALRWCLAAAPRWLKLDHERTFAVARARLARMLGHAQPRMAAYLTFGPDLPCTYGYAQMGREDHGLVAGALDATVLGRLANHHIALIQPKAVAS